MSRVRKSMGTNQRKKAKKLLVELTNLTPEQKKYLLYIVENGEAFLKLTAPDNRSQYRADRLPRSTAEK